MEFFVAEKRWLVTLFVLSLGISFSVNKDGFAQKYNILQYTANSGLPSNNIFDVEFDHKGNIWFASYNGLIKYDGANYFIYDEEKGLKDPVLFNILIDSDQTLWASTEQGGLAKYENGAFHYPKNLAMVDSVIILYIGESQRKELWLSLERKGIAVFNKDLQLVKTITEEDGLPSNIIFHLNYQLEGKVLISTYEGFAIYNEMTGEIEKTYDLTDGLSGQKTYASLVDEKGSIWIATDKGVTIVHDSGYIENKETVAGSSLGYIYSIQQTPDGKIWLGSEKSGLFWIKDGEETKITTRNGLSSNNIFNLVKSKTGEIWIATDGNGVNLFIDNEFKFYNETSPLDAYSATSILKSSDGTIWISTENGLSSYKEGNFQNYLISGEEFIDELVLSSIELPNNNILLLTNNYSLIEFDGENYLQSSLSSQFENELISYVKNIDGVLWLVALRKIIKVDGQDVQYFEPKSSISWQRDINLLFKDSRGLMWVATQGGLALLDSGSFKYITTNDGLSGNRISRVEEDNYGNLWVVSNIGIDVISGINESGSFTSITPFKTNDLYFKETNFLQFDSFGNLWQGTNSGLNYYDLTNWEQTGEASHFHFPLENNGKGTEFGYEASLLDEDSTMYFGTNNNGLITFKYENLKQQLTFEKPPKVYIRSIKAGNEIIYNQEINDELPDRFDLDYSQNNLLVKLNAISEKYPQRIHFKYRLDGINQEWILAENISEIRYESLPSGEFRLLMQTKAPNSSWSEVEVLTTINVQKPFYLSFWFLGTVLLVSVSLFYLIEKGRLTFVEKKLLKSKVDAQTKDIQKALDEKEVLIKEIHHRVKNNLAVISGLLNLQSRQIDEGPATEALQNSMTRVMAMAKIHEQLYQNEDLANVNFKKFITDLVRSLDSTISNADLPILINEHVEEVLVDVNVGVPLGLMINEILSNSFKHAFSELEHSKLATIDIEFSKINDFYHLRIADNGIGSNEDLIEINHQSLGMTLIKSWAKQLDAELTFDGSNGAVFEAKIPV